MTYYADVIVPVAVSGLFTYELTPSQAAQLAPAMRVFVAFGKNKKYTALVAKIHTNSSGIAYDVKPIEQIIDTEPIATQKQLQLWSWISDYYMCSIGMVFKAAIPSAFLLNNTSFISLTDTFIDVDTLSKSQQALYVFLQEKKQITLKQAIQHVGKQKAVSLIYSLLELAAISVTETLKENYTPKMVRYLRLGKDYQKDKTAIAAALKQLDTPRTQKQKQVLDCFLALPKDKVISKKMLVQKSNCSAAVVGTLVKKGILQEYMQQTDRVVYHGAATVSIPELSSYQKKALQQIQQGFTQKDTVLLHGVTSSGKTTIYAKCIAKALEQKKQVLYLVPEIALTTQLIGRLQRFFGDKIAVYHSKYTVNERVEVWDNIRFSSDRAQIVIGARSSLFLPFQDLGLIIVDEEHEQSFKQQNPAPRYQARDTALVLAKLHGAKTLLGSATPSIESYYNAQQQKYELVTLDRRFGDVLLPEIQLIDIKEKYRKKRMKGHFSDVLFLAIEQALLDKKQVILFQNRRGYASILECTTCGDTVQCTNCDVSLTYHQYSKQLRCHYCGYHMALQQRCLSCHSPELTTKGLGTQQIEQELLQLFPGVKVARMDLDTTRAKNSYQNIITDFELEKTQILVGTQMLTKGLDFSNVHLVGVLNADNLLHFPDFRAHERTYQLLSQVSGRAGRSKDRGKVLIQTYNPYHQILQQVSTTSYTQMFKEQLEDRKNFKYPPFYKIIQITLKHRDYNTLNAGADWFATALRNVFLQGVLGPEFPAVARVRNLYIKQCMLKLPASFAMVKVKQSVLAIENSFKAIAPYSGIQVFFDVDMY